MRAINDLLRIGLTTSDTYILNGAPVVDVATHDGGFFAGTPLLTAGGASLIPIAKNAKVYLLFPQRSFFPLVLGTVGLTSPQYKTLNATPHLDRLYTYIGTLQQKIDALEQTIAAMAPAVVAANTTAATAATAANNVPLADQLAQQAADITEGASVAAALGPLRPASTIRTDSEQDITPYVIIP